MSVHAQAPLENAGTETAVSLDTGVREAESPGALPGTLYKSGLPPALRPTPGPAARSDVAAQQPEAPRAAPAIDVRAAKARPAPPEPRVPDRKPSFPQLLLAEAPGPSVMPMLSTPLTNNARDSRLRIRPDAPREPTEVHVHIGRIEVIAAPEPAAPKKTQKPATRPTVPLADYLARKARP
jgi:hypothetical protein